MQHNLNTGTVRGLYPARHSSHRAKPLIPYLSVTLTRIGNYRCPIRDDTFGFGPLQEHKPTEELFYGDHRALPVWDLPKKLCLA